MASAKIVYTPAGAGAQTLTLTFPLRQVPAYSKNAVRHDNVSTTGIRESVLERVENIQEVVLDYIPAVDVPAWQAFLDHALTGSPFAYYPDGAQPAYTNYLLEDTEALVAHKAVGVYSLRMKWREEVS